MGHFSINSQDQGLFAYHLMPEWTRFLPDLWTFGAGFYSFLKGTFVYGLTPNMCHLAGRQKSGMSHATIMLTAYLSGIFNSQTCSQ